MMNREQIRSLICQAIGEYEAACAKHPVFPTCPTVEPKWQRLMTLERLRTRFNHNDESQNCTIQSVQEEELLEAIAEAETGNWAKACEETIHLIATAVRAYEYYLARLEAEKGEEG